MHLDSVDLYGVRLYRMELFKLCCRKFFLLSMAAGLALLMLYFFFVNLGDERSTVNGKVYTGYEAVQTDRRITEEFAGVLTDEKAERIIEKYGFPSVVEENYGGFRDENYLNGFVTEYLGNGYMRDWNDYKISTKLRPVAESEPGQAAAHSGGNIVLGYAKGWTVFLDMFQMAMIFASILVLTGISPVFAQERQIRTADLLFTARNGKETDTRAKIAASFTLAAFIYAVFAAAAFVPVKFVYGFDGAACMTGTVVTGGAVNSAYPVTVKPVWYFTAAAMILGFAALLVLCAAAFCISAHSESSFHAFAVAGAVWMAPLLVRIMFGGAGYFLMMGTPLFLVMTGVVQELFPAPAIPLAVAAGTLVFCTGNALKPAETSDSH